MRLPVAILTALLLGFAGGCGNDAGLDKSAGDSHSDSPSKSRPKAISQGDWSTKREQAIGPLQVRIDAVELGRALVGDEKGDGFNPSQEKFLLVRLTLTNVGPDQRLRYSGWATHGASVGGHTGRLLDETGTAYPAKTDFDGQPVQGRVEKATDILADRPLTELLLFAAPPAGVQELKLELPGTVVLVDGYLRFAIPAVVIQR